MPSPGLTTTSYAILGLLATRPWTTYELAGQMRRALGFFWPRAESNLYEEPKKLVALGYARASAEAVGRRPRTVYSITAKGRRALRAWMPAPAAGPVLESEQLVKVFFAENGSKADLMRTIAAAHEWARERVAGTVDIPKGYLDGEGPFPERLAWSILCGRFLDDFVYMVADWAEWAAKVVEEWPDDIRHAEPDWETLDDMVANSNTFLSRIPQAARAAE